MTTVTTGGFAAVFAALYVAHHVGDYWVQTDHQATHKGDPHRTGQGRGACLRHVLTYLWTQWLCLGLVALATGMIETLPPWGTLAGLAVSGVTHYWVDRRWTLEWLVNALHALSPGKINFYRLGQPRAGRDDLPTLGTGAWALDQSFHLMFSVFVPALIIAGSL